MQSVKLGLDDSSHESPLLLLNTCTHSTFSIVALYLLDLHLLMILATCLGAQRARGLDESIYESPLPTDCASSTLAFEIALLVLFHDLLSFGCFFWQPCYGRMP